MPIQPSPRAETSRLLFPSLRICISELRAAWVFAEHLAAEWGHVRQAFRLAGCTLWLSSSPVSQPFHQMAASVRLFAEYGLYPRCSPFVKACFPSEYMIAFCATGMLVTLYLCIVTPL